MFGSASRPRSSLEQGMWFLIAVGTIMALSFIAVFVLLPH